MAVNNQLMGGNVIRGLVRGFCAVSAVILATVGLGVVGTSGTAGAAGAASQPILIGLISTSSGPYADPQQPQAIQAYVDNWNAHGGLHGRRIRLIGIDVGIDPTKGAAAARQLVNTPNVVGIIDSSDVGCLSNPFYATSNVAIFAGTLDVGTGSCYIPNVDFPIIKTPGSEGVVPVVKFAVDTFGAKTIAIAAPSSTAAGPLKLAQAYASAHTNAKVLGFNVSPVATAADLDVFIAQAKAAGVTVVFLAAQAQTAALLLQEANRESFGPANGIKYILSENLYTPSAISSIGGAYVSTYGEALTLTNPLTKGAVQIMKKYKVSTIDGIATTGYQTGGALQQVLESVKGPITRDSFLKACEAATSVSLPLTPGERVNLKNPGKDPEGLSFLKVKNGVFVPVGGFTEVRY